MIQEAKQETLKLVEDGWNKHKKELFERNGIDPRTGKIGQDFKNNLELQNTVRQCMEPYLPLIARKLEIFEADQRLAFKSELKEIDRAIVLLNNNFLEKLIKGHNSGLDKEIKRYDNNNPYAVFPIAGGIVGSCISAVLNEVHAHSLKVQQGSGFVPKKFENTVKLGLF